MLFKNSDKKILSFTLFNGIFNEPCQYIFTRQIFISQIIKINHSDLIIQIATE